jgi:hypothetical protein
MTHSHNSGAPLSNQEARAAFAQEALSRWIEEGERLVMPDSGQQYYVIGHRHWVKSAAHGAQVFLIFESRCAVCEDLISFETTADLKYLPRTCPEHHHHSSLKPPPPPKPPARHTPVFDAVRAAVDAYSVIGANAPRETVVSAAMELLPRRERGRDLRRQDVLRAIKRLDETGALGCRIDGDYFIFE